MKKISLIFILTLLTQILIGQIEGLSYSVHFGKYTFRPMFIYDYKPSKGVFVPGSDKDLKELTVTYPKRIDTILDYNPYGERKKIGVTSDRFTINYFVDSTNVKYLDTLLNSEISVLHNDKTCKVYNISIQLLYLDGRKASITFQTNKLSKTKTLSELLDKKNDFYFIISTIKLINEKNEKLEIDDTYGWKIINGT